MLDLDLLVHTFRMYIFHAKKDCIFYIYIDVYTFNYIISTNFYKVNDPSVNILLYYIEGVNHLCSLCF
jgi:hypothetical protein